MKREVGRKKKRPFLSPPVLFDDGSVTSGLWFGEDRKEECVYLFFFLHIQRAKWAPSGDPSTSP